VDLDSRNKSVAASWTTYSPRRRVPTKQSLCGGGCLVVLVVAGESKMPAGMPRCTRGVGGQGESTSSLAIDGESTMEFPVDPMSRCAAAGQSRRPASVGQSRRRTAAEKSRGHPAAVAASYSRRQTSMRILLLDPTAPGMQEIIRERKTVSYEPAWEDEAMELGADVRESGKGRRRLWIRRLEQKVKTSGALCSWACYLLPRVVDSRRAIHAHLRPG
jgi:hypothetical protein